MAAMKRRLPEEGEHPIANTLKGHTLASRDDTISRMHLPEDDCNQDALPWSHLSLTRTFILIFIDHNHNHHHNLLAPSII
jgi:hypothetical protein